MTKHTQPKPTVFMDIKFRSKLEATWAVFLEHHFLVAEWHYEPEQLKHPDTGWTYLPDFIVSIGGIRLYLEIKPRDVSPEYLYCLRQMLRHTDVPLYVAFGGWFKRDLPFLYQVPRQGDPTQYRIDGFPLLPDSKDAIRTAKQWRFDLTSTASGQAEFRRGNPAEAKQHISRWVRQERSKRNTRRRKRED